MTQRVRVMVVITLAAAVLIFILFFFLTGGKKEPGGPVPSGGQVSIPPITIRPFTNLQPKTYLVPKDLTLPERADLFTVTGSFSLTQSIAVNLASRLGFYDPPQVTPTASGQNYVFSNENDDRLSLKENPLSLTLAKNVDYTKNAQPLAVDKSQAREKARLFVSSLGLKLPSELSLADYETYFLKEAGSYSQRVDDISKANRIGVSFSLLLNGHRIFDEASPASLIDIVIGGEGEVVFAQIVLPFGAGVLDLSVIKETTINLKDEKIVKSEIGNGRGIIKFLRLGSEKSEEEVTNLPDLLSLNLPELGYLSLTTGSQRYFYPIYVFKLSGVQPDGRSIEGSVFLEARK